MDEHLHPAHECERCGCDSVSEFRDPDDGTEFEVCNRCQFVLGSEPERMDEIIGGLWASHDIRGTPYPEDIHAVMQDQQAAAETYELHGLTSIELDEMYDRSVRICEAFDVLQGGHDGPPEPDMDPQLGPYDPGIEFYLP